MLHIYNLAVQLLLLAHLLDLTAHQQRFCLIFAHARARYLFVLLRTVVRGFLGFELPIAYGGGLFIIYCLGLLFEIIFNIQWGGYWWLVLIGTYILSLIYFIYEPGIRAKLKRKKVAWVLILYWKEKLVKSGKNEPSEREVELVRNMFMERVNAWAWSDPELWHNYFPEEEYPEYLFNIVDNFVEYWQNWKEKYDKG